MTRKIEISAVAVVAVVTAALLLAGTGMAAAKSSAAFSCGSVKGQPVRAVKGVADRSTCRTLAKVALTRFKFKPACGQWNTGEPDCMAGGWYCSIPAAEVQEVQNLIAYCYDPKPGAKQSHEEYVPGRWQGLFKIGGQGSADARSTDGRAEPGLLRRHLPCHTVAQTVSELQGISCGAAVAVVEAAYGQVHPHFPECPGDGAKSFRGWRLKAHPLGGGAHPGIGTRFSKDRKSFLVSGGGVC